jgi:hypothetical protein
MKYSEFLVGLAIVFVSGFVFVSIGLRYGHEEKHIPPEPEHIHVLVKPTPVQHIGDVSEIDVDGTRCIVVSSTGISCRWPDQVERCTTDTDCMLKNGGDGGPSTLEY